MTMVKSNTISAKPWGSYQRKEIMLFRMTNETGAYVELMNYGATLVSVVVPDKFQKSENVILGYPSLKGYLEDTCYIGSTIGRFANRINGAQFELDGAVYQLEKNDGNNTNHGGTSGFHTRVFDHTIQENKLVFTLLSRDREGGYPGNLKLSVEYSWSENNQLSIEYVASSDKKTVANFTNHAYFNLSPSRDDIFDHQLIIRSSQILEMTRHHIPTGAIISAGDKKFNDNKVYERVKTNDGMMTGLNTYYLFDRKYNGLAVAICQMSDAVSGRVLDVFTTYPGVQLYTGDFLTSSNLNNRSSFHKPFDGLCLECQYCPDSPNHAHFPSTILEPGKIYHEKIVYRFSVKDN